MWADHEASGLMDGLQYTSMLNPSLITCIEQRKIIMNILQENSHMPHGELIQLANQALNRFKQENETKKQVAEQEAKETQDPNQLIKPGNYRTVPCRNYHGPNGCTRGDFCHFIHAIGYESKKTANYTAIW